MSSSGPVFQNAVYVGINLQDILYGIELVLYVKTMHVLLTRKGHGRRTTSDLFYAVFSSVMLLMTTIWVSTQAVFGEMMWVEDVGFPGGDDAFWATYVSVWYMDLGTTAVVVLQLMTDALMIYRCWMICGRSRAIIVAPAVLWLATLVLGILVIWSTSSPGGNFFAGFAAQLGLAYYSISVGLTVLLTGAICYRVATHGRMVKRRLGEDYASVYFALLAVMVESVLPYSLSGIAFLISFGIGSGTSIGFACVYILLMCISPQMVILRMASGLAWSEDKDRVLPSTFPSLHGNGSVWTEPRCAEDGGEVGESGDVFGRKGNDMMMTRLSS